jgi:hypothetical protein
MIIASEAASRLAATGAWARIVVLQVKSKDGVESHAVTAFRPTTSTHIWIYDETYVSGSFDTGIVLRDADADLHAAIGALARKIRKQIIEYHYVV